MSESEPGRFVGFVGLDWADREHEYHAIDQAGTQRAAGAVRQSPEELSSWIAKLTLLFGPGKIAICLEQSRGAVIASLMQHPNLVLFPVNPKQLARFREAIHPSGGKDDPQDAKLLANFVHQHRESLREWRPDDRLSRKLDRLCQNRRKLVGEKTRHVQRLRQLLKEYYPLMLQLFGDNLACAMVYDFLMRWPTLKKAQRAKPEYIKKFFHQHNCRSGEKIQQRLEAIRTSKPLTTDSAIVDPSALMLQATVKQLRELEKAIDQFDREIANVMEKHPNRAIFESLPGAGKVLAPRLAAAMGTDRERFGSASELQAFSGIAPVTKRSGRSCLVRRRYACPKYLRQTFHEFAEKSVLYSRWARAYYNQMRSRGTRHNAAVRALAFKWIRIIYRMWTDGVPYDENQYIETLKQRNSQLAKSLTPA